MMESISAEVSTPISPWGKIQSNTEGISFADIMSEQLANGLQIKEDVKFVGDRKYQPVPINIDIESVDGCENDHTIAQMLQMQYDKEYDEMLKKTEDKFNGTSKVSVSYSNYRVIPDHLLYDSDDSCDIDESCRDWDSFVRSEKHFKSMPKCGYKKEGDEMVTKHDIAMSGRRNACKVMDFPPEFHTGDGGGFDMKLSNKVYNSLKMHSKNEQARKNRIHDKSDQATAELGIDSRTRLLLYKLVNQEVLDRVNGTLSTGKESVVLHADGGAGNANFNCIPKECAIKVYKTTLNEFKTRDKYILGDFRFKDRFSKQNPRKIIHLWAEKEMHNLNRMKRAGITCPTVVIWKKHILVMSFIGENHRPAQKLKDAFLEMSDLILAYEECLDTMKKLYSVAELVHADLSEYNILWHDGKCWFIDVSQAVDRNHPKAMEFLFRDCTNISSFFNRKGVSNVLTPDDIFFDITGMRIPEDGGPGTLGQVLDFERNEELLAHEQAEKLYPFDYCWEISKG